jgi:pimeloyl-ACP methyl ester carboxylesterase
MAARSPRPIGWPYLDQGTGAPVVLVHASITDHRIWGPHANSIGRRFRVIAPTQRHFGNYPWPDDGQTFSVATHANDLAEFIQSLQLGPVSLVGWSYGAAVCLTMTAQRPELVHQLIVYEPAIISFVDTSNDAQAATTDRSEMTAQARAQLARGDTTTAVRAFMDGVNDQPGAFDSLPHRVRQIMHENRRTLPMLFAAPPPPLSCDDLKRLEAKRVIVACGQDTRAYYTIAAQYTAACIPESTLVRIPNARHLLPVQDHARFTTHILDPHLTTT